jgi:hypothetical protein
MELKMARRLNWEKAALAAKPKLSIRNEQDYLERGFTALWLERAEKRVAAQRKSRWKKRVSQL